MISPELVRKSWNACGYPTEDQLTWSNVNNIFVYDDAHVKITMERIYGKDARANFADLICGTDPYFPSDDECSSDDKTEELFNEAAM